MAYDSPRIPVPGGRRAGAERGRIPVWLVLLLVGSILVALLLLLNAQIGVSTTTQTTQEPQCPQAEQSFDERQAAFILAQKAESQRSAAPYPGNYGLSSYLICYEDGTSQTDQSPVFKGHDNYTDPAHPRNYTHSEQSAYGWLQLQFSRISIDLKKVAAIYTVIFSQVVVCSSCEEDAVDWQRVLRQKAKTEKLYLSLWDIQRGKGFNPATYPAGNGVPVTPDMLEKVSIPFLP